MIYIKIRGNDIIEQDTSDIIVQNSYRANKMFIVFEDQDLKSQECRVTFGRDGIVDVGMSDLATIKETIDGEYGCSYNFSSRKVTEEAGELDVAIKLYDNSSSATDKVVSTANTILYVTASVNQSSVTPTIDEAQYNALSEKADNNNDEINDEKIKSQERDDAINRRIDNIESGYADELSTKKIIHPLKNPLILGTEGNYSEIISLEDFRVGESILFDCDGGVGYFTGVKINGVFIDQIYETKEELTNTLTDYATKQYVQDYVNENITLALESDY